MKEEIELETTFYCSHKNPEFTLLVTQEKMETQYFSYRYVVFWHPQIGGMDHIVHAGSGSTNTGNAITDSEKQNMLERATNLVNKGVWKLNTYK